MWLKTVVSSLVVVLCVSACVAPDPDPRGAARARIGQVFDPLNVHPGDTIAGLVVTRIDVQRAVVDSTPVGSIAFRGELPLTGRRLPHFEPDAALGASVDTTVSFSIRIADLVIHRGLSDQVNSARFIPSR